MRASAFRCGSRGLYKVLYTVFGSVSQQYFKYPRSEPIYKVSGVSEYKVVSGFFGAVLKLPFSGSSVLPFKFRFRV